MGKLGRPLELELSPVGCIYRAVEKFGFITICRINTLVVIDRTLNSDIFCIPYLDLVAIVHTIQIFETKE